eukprot:gene702-28904_t
MTSSIVTLAVIATMYIMGGPVVSAAAPTFDENPTACPDGFVLTASAKDDPTEIATTNSNSDFDDDDFDDDDELGPCPIEEEPAGIIEEELEPFPGIDGPLKVNPRESGCKPYTPCPAGWYTAVGFDEQITPVCKPCPTGYFKALPSTNGETEDWEAVCRSRTVCSPGTYTSVAAAESRTENHQPTCISCEEGKFMRFNPSPYDTNECEPHRPCQPGTYRASLGTRTSNTICPVCPTGFFSDTEDADACTPYAVCPAGKYTINTWSKTKDLTCTACGTGKFNQNSVIVWASQNDPGPCHTPETTKEICRNWTPCGPGMYAAALGTAATDTVCLPCPINTFFVGGNHFSEKCFDLTPCPPGEFQSNTVPTSGASQPNKCQPCPSDRYKPSVSPGVLAPDDPDLCQSQPTCPKGTHTPVAKDSSQMTVEVGTDGCVACSAGQYQPLELPTTSVSSCDTITLCEAGTFTSKIGTPESDAECAPCSETTYQPNASLSFNDTELDCPEPHRAPCEAGAYTSTAATAARASTCTSCPSGTYKSAASGTIFQPEQASISCTQKPVCGPGESTSPTQPPDDKTALQNPECTACATGTFKPGPSANAWDVAAQSVSTSEICMPHTLCPSGTYTSKAGSATEDTTCTNCPSGSFKPFASASTTETDSCHAWVPKPGCCREISSEIDVNGDSVDVSSAADANTVSVQTFPAVPGAAAGTKCEIACENDETCTAVEVEVDLTSDTAAATCEFHTGTINAATRAGNACKKNHFCMIKNAVPSAAKEIDDAQWTAKSGCCRENSELGKFTHNENVIVVNILIPNSVSDAVVACKQECDAMEGCTAVEVRRFSKAKTPYFKCELHTADINSATRSSKSCKQAKCEIKK